MEPGSNGSKRLLTLRLNTSDGPVTLVSAYALTLSAIQETKDENLSATVSRVPRILLGDFNARAGCDNDSWPLCLGHLGVGKINDNGQRLLEFCTFNNLCATDTYLDIKPQHKDSWRHLRSKHWHQHTGRDCRPTLLPQVRARHTYLPECRL